MDAGPTARTTVKRGANRAKYDRASIREILEAGLVAHVGVSADDGPIVLPMAYGVRSDELLLHGSVANALMRTGRGFDVCATVTVVDGLVVARTPFHNSMNYRSVVVRGTATPIEDAQAKAAALKVINDHVAELWDSARPPSETDFRKTMVLSVSLAEASAKVRAGDPLDEPADHELDFWAGVVPLEHTWGKPRPAANLRDGVAMPDPVRALGGTSAAG